MLGFIRQLVWFAIVACIFSYVCVLVIGMASEAYAAITTTRRIAISDAVSPGMHQLSGMIPVENTCDEILQHTERTSDTQYEIVFTTWQEPSTACASIETPRVFHAAIAAPAYGIYFGARLDNKELPITIIRNVSTSSIPLLDEQ